MKIVQKAKECLVWGEAGAGKQPLGGHGAKIEDDPEKEARQTACPLPQPGAEKEGKEEPEAR